MSKYKVVVTDDQFGGCYDEEIAVLNTIDAELVIENCKTVGEVVNVCRDADGILLNIAPMPREAIEKLEKCKVIARYGVGFDNVAINAAAENGIRVTNVPDYCAEDVSDHALALMMGCVRKIARRDAEIREGKWKVGRADPIYRTCGKVFTLLGFGMISRCLLRKIKGLNPSHILVYDPFLDEEIIRSYGCEKVDWETALSKADFISIHMPLNDKSQGIIGFDAFKLMKPTAIIVNTSRGAIIDETALIDSLKSGKINSAGLDVHTVEPLPLDSELRNLNNCILSDHIGWYSEESFGELKTKAAENIKAVLSGCEPKYPISFFA